METLHLYCIGARALFSCCNNVAPSILLFRIVRIKVCWNVGEEALCCWLIIGMGTVVALTWLVAVLSERNARRQMLFAFKNRRDYVVVAHGYSHCDSNAIMLLIFYQLLNPPSIFQVGKKQLCCEKERVIIIIVRLCRAIMLLL